MPGESKTAKELHLEIEALRQRLEEAEQVLRGIQTGEVDAIVVTKDGEEKLFTLQGADHTYRVLVEAMSEGAVTVGTDRTILYCNARFAEFTKTPLEKIVTKSLDGFVAPSDRPKLVRLIEESRTANRTGEFILQAADGTGTAAQFSVVSLDLSGAQAICIVVTNLTAVIAAREASLYLATLVESSDDAIIGTNLDGKILSWNPGAERILGFSAQEAIGRPIAMIIPPEVSEEAATLEGVSVGGGSARHLETVRVRKDGTKFDVSLSVSPIRDAFGRVVGTSRILRDISERKRAEKEIRELSGRLLQAQEDERQRLALELHDSTAQSLAAVTLNLGAVGTSNKLDKKSRECLHSALDLTKQCAEEIRDMSHLLHPLALHQRDLAGALGWYVEGFVRRTKIHVDLFISPELGRLPKDAETALFRIVQEGLTNVFRHSGSARARVHLARHLGEVTLQIEDEGRGLSPDGTEDTQGAFGLGGLGIPSMRERARQIGGRFNITSGPKGTAISVTLPCAGRGSRYETKALS